MTPFGGPVPASGTVEVGRNHDNLTALTELLTSGDVKVVIDKVYPFDQGGHAVAHMLGHHARSNIVITI